MDGSGLEWRRKPAPADDTVVMLTTEQLNALGILDPRDVIHPAFQDRYAFLRTKAEVLDVAHIVAGGGSRATKPGARPTTIVGPDGRTPIIVAYDEHTEAAEVEDIVLEAYERAEAKLQKHGSVIDFEGFRERTGKPPKARFDVDMREMLQDNIARHKATTVTDPGIHKREKHKKGQAQASVPATPWKESA